MVATQVKQKIFTDEWNQILEEVAQFRRNSKGNWIWFRGHGDERFKLDSGLFRLRMGNDKLTFSEYNRIESKLYVSFKNQAATFVKDDENDIWFHMQHHGLKTRLLDWTESFGTALYFAFNDWNYKDNKEACIWLVDPFALNFHLHGDGRIFTTKTFDSYDTIHLPFIFEAENKWDKGKKFNNNSFAIYPSKNNSRLLSQSGFFTVQSNRLLDLEEELVQICPNVKDSIIKKIVLPPDLVETIYEYLTINGINDFYIFNDIDGLCKSLNKELAEYAFDDRLKKIAKFSK
ncbi:FRG domain-containing protein [Bacillus cereus]|uniref:FRG domain-containing protein n=1 Tax=Bacillus cereus TaxID=1396 RepID=UPI000BEDFEAF|nr:FRG domain-containing protein [Bacillus cereus]PDZ02665.1 FRG domain-containing protein [Bacillus cereus]PFN11671.1 FRG domain-containing protein [Bacillus cereus]PFS85406.1 FRG domain-containing protein [Bacillus cereus]PGU48382.1 FRG domain-containing protein [Bacillus cereus]